MSHDSNNEQVLLKVSHLSKHFKVKKRAARTTADVFKAVDDVSFTINRGETYGIVGESGSGKTTLARCVLRALTPTSGRIEYFGGDRPIDLAGLSEKELRGYRKDMQMIFQDPFSSLNPRMTVGDIVGEPLLIHGVGRKGKDRRERVAAMLERVGLQADHMNRYPHAFSGGQRQRIGIARAIILNPKFVVADEAVSALDVSVQAQVLDLLKDLQQELGLTYIFVSHDLSVVRHTCDRVAVMYAGRIVERGEAKELFTNPGHPYTRVLLSAIPYPDPDRKMKPLKVSDLSPEDLKPLPQATAL